MDCRRWKSAGRRCGERGNQAGRRPLGLDGSCQVLLLLQQSEPKVRPDGYKHLEDGARGTALTVQGWHASLL